MMSDRPDYVDYVGKITALFDTQDTPGIGGSMNMGTHQLLALEEVHPALYARLQCTAMWPFEGTMAHPELERWVIEHWNDDGE